MKKITSEAETFGVKILSSNNKIYALGRNKIKEKFSITMHCLNLKGDLLSSHSFSGNASNGEYALDMIQKANGNFLITGFNKDSTFNGFY